jgi:hypothetical protein
VKNWYYAEAGKQTGPVTDEQFAELVRTGVIKDDTLVWHDGLTDWQPYRQLKDSESAAPAAYATFPAVREAPAAGVVCAECKKAFPPEEMIRHGNVFICAGCKPVFMQKLAEGAALGSSARGNKTEAEILEGDYRIEIGEALERAWKAFANNAGLMIASFFVLAIIFIACWGASVLLSMVIPGAGLLSVLYAVPLAAGFSWLCLRLLRGEPAEIGDVFAGFTRCYGRLVLYAVIQLLLNIICFLPLIIVAISFGVAGAFLHRGAAAPTMAVGLIAGMSATGFVALCGTIYLNTIFAFTILLIIDKGYRVWAAMQLSRKMVGRRWWMTFLYLFVAAVIYMLGALLCLVGLIITVPLFLAMKAVLYDDNFRDLTPQP